MIENRLRRWLSLAALLALAAPATATAQGPLAPQPVRLAGRPAFTLNVLAGFDLRVAAEGLGRVRFLARSPDGCLFATDMHDRSDNSKGRVYALGNFDASSGRFRSVTTYLQNLRNPNSLAFYTDAEGRHWLYLALTDRLVRYRFAPGEARPTASPQTLATFPDYGLSYKYGGWHLTRTVVIGSDNRVYVSVGSSCNACVEKEAVRASVLVMDLDGKNQRLFARGLRNAVGLKWVGGSLYATNMGADHLGDTRPEETLYRLEDGKNYGWPYCYPEKGRALPDPKFNPGGASFDCGRVPAPVASFPAHAAPLGLERFGPDAAPELRGSFLVALHGSGFTRIGAGYSVVRVRDGSPPNTVVSGFLRNGRVLGRPVDVLAYGQGFLVTDDHAGAIYYLARRN